jgi:cyanate permease
LTTEAAPFNLRLAALALTMGTFASVVFGTILTVPIRDIARDLHVTIAAASLIITAMSLTFGAFMPLAGWCGTRFGQRRVFGIGTMVLALSGLLAAFSPNLETMVGLRLLQGCSSATITPLVIAILAEIYPPAQRARALAGWAAANGLGQAVGPPLGGVIAGWLGWRYTMVAPALIAALACYLAFRYVPHRPSRNVSLDWRSAALLTVGSMLVTFSLAWMPQLGPLSPIIIGALAVGLTFFALFVRLTRRAEHPLVSPVVFVDPAYRRSSFGVFTGTFMLGTAMLGIALYLTHALGIPVAQAGFVAFALPVAMVLSARPTSGIIHRTSARNGLRLGLGTVFVMGLVIGYAMSAHAPIAFLMAAIFVLGIGLSFIHTSCAVGSTASAATRFGGGVGLFNTIRATGTTAGTAWCALVLSREPDAYTIAFVGAALVGAVGFVATYLMRSDEVVEAAAA